jgi:hypothetical protein
VMSHVLMLLALLVSSIRVQQRAESEKFSSLSWESIVAEMTFNATMELILLWDKVIHLMLCCRRDIYSRLRFPPSPLFILVLRAETTLEYPSLDAQ